MAEAPDVLSWAPSISVTISVSGRSPSPSSQQVSPTLKIVTAMWAERRGPRRVAAALLEALLDGGGQSVQLPKHALAQPRVGVNDPAAHLQVITPLLVVAYTLRFLSVLV
jgi:hypothetical protein